MKVTKEDITRMAREAGYGEALADLHALALERFADLVREECAKLCDKTEEAMWESWDELADPSDQGGAITASHLAALIRKRKGTQ